MKVTIEKKFTFLSKTLSKLLGMINLWVENTRRVAPSSVKVTAC